MDTDAAEKRREEIRANIEERSRLRQEANEIRKAEKPRRLPTEEIEAFHKRIGEYTSEIETILSSSDSATPSAIESMLQLITQAKTELSSSAMILPPYDLDRTQALITSYDEKIQEKRSAGTKKKFSFKSAKTVKSTTPAATTPASLTSSATTPPLVPKTTVIIPETLDEDADIDHKRSLRGLTNETVTLGPDRLNVEEGSAGAGFPGDFSLSRLTGCEIRLNSLTTALRLSHLVDCRVICAPINGSIFVQHCRNITLVSASRQIRIHDTTNSTFIIYTQSRPTIETCTGLKFGPYDVSHEKMGEWLKECEFALERNEWENVQDFNWLRANSPNWSAIPVNERSQITL